MQTEKGGTMSGCYDCADTSCPSHGAQKQDMDCWTSEVEDEVPESEDTLAIVIADMYTRIEVLEGWRQKVERMVAMAMKEMQ